MLDCSLALSGGGRDQALLHILWHLVSSLFALLFLDLVLMLLLGVFILESLPPGSLLFEGILVFVVL